MKAFIPPSPQRSSEGGAVVHQQGAQHRELCGAEGAKRYSYNHGDRLYVCAACRPSEQQRRHDAARLTVAVKMQGNRNNGKTARDAVRPPKGKSGYCSPCFNAMTYSNSVRGKQTTTFGSKQTHSAPPAKP